MDWIATPESSNISRFRYAQQTMVLTIEFKNGGRYDYYDVPERVFDGMKTAPSKGQYLAQNIKSRFRYARV
jgi:KTSC domain